MEADHIRPRMEEPHDVVNYENMKRLQLKRLASHRCSVERLPLLVAQGLLDDPDAELRALWLDLVIRILQIPEKSLNTLLSLDVRDNRPVPYPFRIVECYFPMSSFNRLQVLQARLRACSPFLRPVSRRSSFCMRKVSGRVPASRRAPAY